VAAGASILWLGPGLLSLMVFAWLLALTPPAHAGRSFALYGGVCIAAALLWLRVIEHSALRATDLIGGAPALAGAAVILWGAR
jgi:small multidrug resistance family-3 protein